MEEITVVTFTMPSGQESEARTIVQDLLRQRLIACGQIGGPIESSYWWAGEISTSDEIVVTLKTAPSVAQATVAAIAARHPYEVPEIISTHAQASESYAAWVQGECES